MKLLSLEIGDLGKDSSGKDKTFRSLHSGFKVNFHSLTDKGLEAMLEFQPFCFAGLNGSGKSNVLEALASIFYHLEMCVAKYRPASFEEHFSRALCSPDAFTLKYLTCGSNTNNYVYFLSDIVTITKVKGQEPAMIVEPAPLSKNNGREARGVSLKSSDRSQERAPGKEYLPDLIVGYSSGENEILSLPFIKNRLIHFDEYKEAVREGLPYYEPETSLLYIDEEMSQAVLLACMLFENPDTTLKPLKDELGIVGIQSFRININKQTLYLDDDKKNSSPILIQIEHIIDSFKRCSTSWFESESQVANSEGKKFPVLSLDFFVDEATKEIFRDNFNSSFELFRAFQILYELNLNIISSNSKKEVYKSHGFYTDWKLPEAAPEDRVFHFLGYMILKEIDGLEKPKELLLREFSDGEHQFLHTMGICLMLKKHRTLLLLDEPETHFNPSWRAKFIKVLNDSLEAGGTNNFLKDVIITTHSPFIISDCLPNNVIFFDKEILKIENRALKASELDINTYGTSEEIILDRLFGYRQSIGDLSNAELEGINLEEITTKEKIEEIKVKLKLLGDSIEKDMVLARLNRINKNIENA
jgi:restriction system-associated AAA family ATPase